jgi:EmrB/QacA subfamily drug resistance transporter
MRASTKYLIALTASLGMFPMALDATIVNVAIVPISKALATSVDTVQWIFLGYLLSSAAVISLSGYLGNRFGTKRLFVLGLALFTFFSFLCGVAPSEGWLVGFRVLQGLGGGMLIPLGMAIALQPFSREERAKATAVVGIPVLLAPVLGPIVGGLLVDNLSWHAIFFVNVPIGLLAIALAALVIPADQIAAADGPRRFDYVGLVLSTLGVVSLIYAFKLVSQTQPHSATALQPQGSIYGWGYWPVWALAGGGLALLVLFTVHTLRLRDDPVLDLRLFTRYDFAISNVVVWVSSIVTFGVMFLVPVYLQEVHLPNLSALDTGIALLPLGVATIVGMALSAGLYRKLGPRIPVVVGALLFAASCWRLTGITPATTAGDLAPWLGLLGLGLAFTLVPTQTLALEALSGAALNKATSLVNAGKLLWSSIGSAVLVTIFVQQTTAHWDQLRGQLLHSVPAGGVPDLHAPQVVAAYHHLLAQAGASALADVFKLLVYVAAVLVVVALAMPGRRAATEATAEQPAPAAAERSATVA